MTKTPQNHEKADTEGLILDGVSRSFGARKAVDDVSFAVAPGELVCLLGPSGCGKSTSLRIAAGLEMTESGRVLLHGQEVAKPGVSSPPEKRRIGYLFQDFALFPHLSVAENVAFGIKDWSHADQVQRIDEMLGQVGMTEHKSAYPHMLSGGQQQRVALARALAPKPWVVLLDEPFSGLDSRLRDQVRDQTLHVLKNSGVATLMVTHDPEEAMFMADHIVLMRDGKVVQTGRPVDLYYKPVNAFATQFFGEVNRIEGVVEGGMVSTALGNIGLLRAHDFKLGDKVQVLIRPEGLLLQTEGSAVGALCKSKVLFARMLGRSSLVHLCAGQGGKVHLHARAHGRFLPAEEEILEIRLDPAQTFVFSLDEG